MIKLLANPSLILIPGLVLLLAEEPTWPAEITISKRLSTFFLYPVGQWVNLTILSLIVFLFS